MGLLWWLSNRESACQSGDTGSVPDSGRFYMPQSNQIHVLQLLKPVSPRARALQQEKPPQWEACALQLQETLFINEDPEQS